MRILVYTPHIPSNIHRNAKQKYKPANSNSKPSAQTRTVANSNPHKHENNKCSKPQSLNHRNVTTKFAANTWSSTQTSKDKTRKYTHDRTSIGLLQYKHETFLLKHTKTKLSKHMKMTNPQTRKCTHKIIIILLLFIKVAFKRTLLKQINSIKTVLKQC